MYCYPIVIHGNKLSCFSFVIGECETCKKKYEHVCFESQCDDTIRYCLYVGNNCCTCNDDLFLEEIVGTHLWSYTKWYIITKEEKDATRKNLEKISTN